MNIEFSVKGSREKSSSTNGQDIKRGRELRPWELLLRLPLLCNISFKDVLIAQMLMVGEGG